MERVYEELLRRAEEAIEEAVRQHERASDLTAFVRALKAIDPAELARCAWCGRVRAGDRWLDPGGLLGTGLRERLRNHATHGICPECFDRVTAEAERERLQRQGR